MRQDRRKARSFGRASALTQGPPCIAWRRGPESNRHTRICSPLHSHSATTPPLISLSFYSSPPSQGGRFWHMCRHNVQSSFYCGVAPIDRHLARSIGCRTPHPFGGLGHAWTPPDHSLRPQGVLECRSRPRARGTGRTRAGRAKRGAGMRGTGRPRRATAGAFLL